MYLSPHLHHPLPSLYFRFDLPFLSPPMSAFLSLSSSLPLFQFLTLFYSLRIFPSLFLYLSFVLSIPLIRISVSLLAFLLFTFARLGGSNFQLTFIESLFDIQPPPLHPPLFLSSTSFFLSLFLLLLLPPSLPPPPRFPPGANGSRRGRNAPLFLCFAHALTRGESGKESRSKERKERKG